MAVVSCMYSSMENPYRLFCMLELHAHTYFILKPDCTSIMFLLSLCSKRAAPDFQLTQNISIDLILHAFELRSSLRIMYSRSPIALRMTGHAHQDHYSFNCVRWVYMALNIVAVDLCFVKIQGICRISPNGLLLSVLSPNVDTLILGLTF